MTDDIADDDIATSAGSLRPRPRTAPTGPGFLQAARLAWAATGFALLAACATPPAPGSAMPGPPPAAEAGTPAARLQALFDTAWDADMRRNPEWATLVGDQRFGDRLQDASPEAEAAGFADARRRLAEAEAISPAALSAKDRVSRELFMDRLRDRLRYEPFTGYRRMTLGAIGGFHSQFAELLLASPVTTRPQVDQLLARLAAYPRRVEQEIARLAEGRALGWVPPRAVLERVLASLDKQLAAPLEASPFLEPFRRLGADIPAADQARLREDGRRVVAEQVLPAQRGLRDFIAGAYLAAAPASGALSSYPGGAAVYAAAVRTQTTTELTPRQIHEMGQREVDRLRGEIAQVMAEMGWKGDFASFVRHLNTDPRYFHAGPAELLAAYRDIAKRIDAELPRLFAELPRATYGVRAMPSFSGPDRAEFYNAPTQDGSSPGWFNANAQAFRTRPKWGQETLTAHEAVPGHHLQTARALEQGTLPRFRRSNWYVAYGEGWALYAETLGSQLGLYQDPASRFGHLQSQIFRAVRLQADTGIHAFGWTRQRAIDYMVEQTGEERGFVESEIDRYTSWPAQALGYMIGNLKIVELRERARARLGERFDIRRFHMVVLDSGAVPLSLLERLVDEWIAAEASARPAVQTAGAPAR